MSLTIDIARQSYVVKQEDSKVALPTNIFEFCHHIADQYNKHGKDEPYGVWVHNRPDNYKYTKSVGMLNTFSGVTWTQREPAVALVPDGTYSLKWTLHRQDGHEYYIFAYYPRDWSPPQGIYPKFGFVVRHTDAPKLDFHNNIPGEPSGVAWNVFMGVAVAIGAAILVSWMTEDTTPLDGNIVKA